MRRILHLDNTVEIIVEINGPIEDKSTDGHFVCAFSIIGMEGPVSSAGMGIDALQAFTITMGLIGNRLYSSDIYKQGRLRWIGGLTNNDLGFPNLGIG